MKKIVYEKPEMLIEEFMATQSVAATCEYTAEEVANMGKAIKVTPGDKGCSHGDGGHKVVPSVLEYDDNSDGTTAVFTSAINACELCYDTDAGSNIQSLGTIINGTGCFSSDQHKMMIGEYQVFS